MPVFLAVLAGLLLLATPASAAPGVALIIGNGAYRQERLALPNPPLDAEIMDAKLRARGFSTIVVRDGDLAGMRAGLQAFRARAALPQTPGSPAASASHFVYYSGHGVQIGGANYLLPVDVDIIDADALRRSSLDLAQVLDAVRGLPSVVNFVVLDACRSNPFADAAAPQGLASVDQMRNAFVAFSAAPGMNAFDGGGRNSRFTAALAMALGDETASAQEVFLRAREYVVRTSDGAQTPDYVDTISMAGGDPWAGRGMGAAVIGSAQIGQTRGLITPSRPADLTRVRQAGARLRGTPAPAADADLSAWVWAMRLMLDTGAQDASIKPDYMEETYADVLKEVLTAAAADKWSAYDLSLFLAHAAQETYQFQALAEYGSPAFFARYEGRADLGNTVAGDGARYRGRGLLQLRGRANYRRLAGVAGLDLESDPDAVARDRSLSARVSAAMFNAVRPSLTGVPDADIETTTRALTGATRDVGLRGHYLYRLLSHFSVTGGP
jgi:hypothetical protein